MRFVVSAIVLLAPYAARAEPSLAIGLNAPVHWPDAVGASVYVGVSGHSAVRANVARYAFAPNAVGELVGGFLAGVGTDGTYAGAVTDLGVAWMYFPRRLWSGFSVETGLVVRERDHSVTDGAGSAKTEETDTVTSAARATVGWSWLIAEHVFVSVAVGVSAGYETGVERASPWSEPSMPVTHGVARLAIEPEGFVRFGGAFGR